MAWIREEYARAFPIQDYENKSSFGERTELFKRKLDALESIVSSWKYKVEGRKRTGWACGSLGYKGANQDIYRCRSRGRYFGAENCRPAAPHQREIKCAGYAEERRVEANRDEW